jgi:hypothetical protein
VLFVPVSGPYGMGEFARCSAIASGVLERWPGASLHFLVSRHAPYAAQIPFPVTLLPSSATFHSAAVIELMRSWLPDIVVFDNAGRSAQLEAARRLGARIVFISSRARQRRRAFRLAWMRMLDEHWIAYPKFIAGDLGVLERFKLKLLRRPLVRYLDVILAHGTPSAGTPPPPSGARREVLVIPGGGTGHPGAGNVTGQFLMAAKNLAAAGFATTYVGPIPGRGAAHENGHFRSVGSLPQAELAERMRGAELLIVNGGSTLLQGIACGAPCVAAPIANDQHERIRRCAELGVAVEADAIAGDIHGKARSLLNNDAARAALAQRARKLALADGVEVAVNAIAGLARTS